MESQQETGGDLTPETNEELSVERGSKIENITAQDAREHLETLVKMGRASQRDMENPKVHFEYEVERVKEKIKRLEAGDETACNEGRTIEESLAHLNEVVKYQEAYASVSPEEGPFT